jgi:3-methyladenine DNA glycosylase AlkD
VEVWAFEERLLAVKMLGCVCRKDPERALRLVETFSAQVNDWAVCDTLATQSVRAIAKKMQSELLELSGRLVKLPNFWERRFAAVLLTNYAKPIELRKRVLGILRHAEDDREHYVRKAVEWLRRDLEKGGQKNCLNFCLAPCAAWFMGRCPPPQ